MLYLAPPKALECDSLLELGEDEEVVKKVKDSFLSPDFLEVTSVEEYGCTETEQDEETVS